MGGGRVGSMEQEKQTRFAFVFYREATALIWEDKIIFYSEDGKYYKFYQSNPHLSLRCDSRFPDWDGGRFYKDKESGEKPAEQIWFCPVLKRHYVSSKPSELQRSFNVSCNLLHEISFIEFIKEFKRWNDLPDFKNAKIRICDVAKDRFRKMSQLDKRKMLLRTQDIIEPDMGSYGTFSRFESAKKEYMKVLSSIYGDLLKIKSSKKFAERRVKKVTRRRNLKKSEYEFFSMMLGASKLQNIVNGK